MIRLCCYANMYDLIGEVFEMEIIYDKARRWWIMPNHHYKPTLCIIACSGSSTGRDWIWQNADNVKKGIYVPFSGKDYDDIASLLGREST